MMHLTKISMVAREDSGKPQSTAIFKPRRIRLGAASNP